MVSDRARCCHYLSTKDCRIILQAVVLRQFIYYISCFRVESPPLLLFFFFNDPAPTEISTLPLHDALPIFSATRFLKRSSSACWSGVMIWPPLPAAPWAFCRSWSLALVFCSSSSSAWILKKAQGAAGKGDRKSTRLNSSHDQISYAVFCLKK